MRWETTVAQMVWTAVDYDGARFVVNTGPVTVESSGSGVTDHGALTGLADNDHPQYALAASLGNSASRNVGTTAGTVAAGDDSRLSDSRTPSGGAGGALSGTYPDPGLNTEAVQDLVGGMAGTGLTYDDDAGTLNATASDSPVTKILARTHLF